MNGDIMHCWHRLHVLDNIIHQNGRLEINHMGKYPLALSLTEQHCREKEKQSRLISHFWQLPVPTFFGGKGEAKRWFQ